MQEKMLKVTEKFINGKGWVVVNASKTVLQIKRMFNINTTLINIKTDSSPTGGDYNRFLFESEFCKAFEYEAGFNKDLFYSIKNELLKSDDEIEEYGQEYTSVKLEVADDIEEQDLFTLYVNITLENGDIESHTVGEGSTYSILREINKIEKKIDFKFEVMETC